MYFVVFIMFNDLRSEVIVRFVDIGGIVTCGRSVVFSGHSGFLQRQKLTAMISLKYPVLLKMALNTITLTLCCKPSLPGEPYRLMCEPLSSSL